MILLITSKITLITLTSSILDFRLLAFIYLSGFALRQTFLLRRQLQFDFYTATLRKAPLTFRLSTL